MATNHPNILAPVRTRFLLIAWLVIPYYLPGADALFAYFQPSLSRSLWQIAYIYYAHAFFGLVVLLTAMFPARVPFCKIIGGTPSRAQSGSALALSVYLYLIAIPSAYVIWLPLSYWVPTLVENWYLNAGDIVYFERQSYPILANFLSVFSLCVAAPIIEEFAFRGLILSRWIQKFGLAPAILLSSLLFGIVHPDPVGAFIFSAVMCILYLRTQSLMVPILCHSFFNLIVWLVELGVKFRFGPTSRTTLADFQNGWILAAIAFTIVLFWTTIYFRRRSVEAVWKLPGE